MKSKIPVTLLVGFLGSGKTTLLSEILKGDHGLKIAVIENEFGEINIDNEILSNEIKSKDDFIIEMSNGCLCCSSNGDLIKTLKELLLKLKDFDHVVIEATGMASPGPIIQSLRESDDIKKSYELNSVVTLVDCKNFFSSLENTKNDDEFKFEKQLIFSDLILLNKVDLIYEELRDLELGHIKSFIKKMNSEAELLETIFCKIDIHQLLHRRGQDIESITKLSSGNHVHHRHDKAGIEQISIEMEGVIDPETFQLFLNTLYLKYRNRLFRMKGVVHFENQPHCILVQGVNDQLEFKKGAIKEGDQTNKLVFIGVQLKKEVILKSLQNCLASNVRS